MSKAALVRVRELNRVFEPLSESNFEAIIARLAPLYEDLRIELHGIAKNSIASLDQLDVRYRRIYFLRRSLATLCEFAESLRHLESCPEFGLIASQLAKEKEIDRRWRRASAFFKRQETTLKLVRNDIGGHFGLEAARYASKSLLSDAVDGIEITEPATDHSLVFLRFSGELVATAMLRHAWGLNREHKIRRLITIAHAGYRHATRSVHGIAVCYLWDRFG
jgi:hypothetical protein